MPLQLVVHHPDAVGAIPRNTPAWVWGLLAGLLVLGIFLVKSVVGVELAMAPRLAQDTQYALTVAALYGAFTGVFVGRATRLWRLALRPAARGAAA